MHETAQSLRHLRIGAIASALMLVAACQPAPPAVMVVTAPAPAALGAQLTTTLPPAVPLQTALALSYGTAMPASASLYTVSSSGQVMRLFENRPVQPGVTTPFPDRTEPVMRFGPPAGAEQFVLVVTQQPFRWLAPADYADTTPYARLTLDRIGFEQRLSNAVAALPPGTWQVQRLTITTQ
jgi:hypothetical protein